MRHLFNSFGRLTPFLKPAALAGCFAFQLPDIVDRFASITAASAQSVYFGLLCICWAGIVGAAFTRNAVLRWSWAILLSLMGGMMAVFMHASQQFMTYDAYINMVNSAGFVGDAWDQNRVAFLAAMPPAALMLLGVGLPGNAQARFLGGILWIVPFLVLAIVTAMLFIRGGDGGRGLPGGIVVSAYGALFGYELATGDAGERAEVTIAPGQPPSFRTIVLIVDESIAPAYLDINSSEGVATPLSRAHETVAVHNFGIAAAITGCSIGSNYTLRHGGTRDQYKRYNATYPSIWAYAKAAGMRTIYLDGQREDGAYQNMMDDAERAQIDQFIQFGDVPVVDRDIAIAEKLTGLTADPEPKFVLVNKVGAHFPVNDKFPDKFATYAPALPRGNFRDITDTGSRAGFGGTPQDWRRYRNSYRNTLRWSVGEFFERLIADGQFEETLVLYTADHGQILHENNSPGLSTHCSPQPPMEEGAVPLVALTGNARADWGQWAKTNHDRSSHYMLFPTLLGAMGYSAQDISPVYGGSLLQPSTDPMTFNTLFNARLNRQPEWKRVVPERLPQPPLND